MKNTLKIKNIIDREHEISSYDYEDCTDWDLVAKRIDDFYKKKYGIQ